MIDFRQVVGHWETSRLEAKRAAGGLPDSIWETYSAFANTQGGVILLGVEEEEDKSLRLCGVKDADEMIDRFWRELRKPRRVSVNLLRRNQVYRQMEDGLEIVVIEIPRASRRQKPVYIGGDPYRGTYRRSGEGDYHCDEAEITAMLRDSAAAPQDGELVLMLTQDALCRETIGRYRERLALMRPKNRLILLPEEEFLTRIGVLGTAKDGSLHPTVAGLLLFGREDQIRRQFPDYYLDYHVVEEETGRWSDRLTSDSADWSGNVYDFYFMVCDRLPCFLPDGQQAGAKEIADAVREGLANALIHASYHGKQGIVVACSGSKIVLTNPGGLRVYGTWRGGISDPRNSTIARLFALVKVGTGTGSGLARMREACERNGYPPPRLTEHYGPDRTELVFRFASATCAEKTAE